MCQSAPLWRQDARWASLPAGGRSGSGKVPDARQSQGRGRAAGRAQRQLQARPLDLEEVQARATARARMRGIRAYLKGAVRGRGLS